MTVFFKRALAASGTPHGPESLLASRRHTLIFFAILIALTVIGGVNSRAQPTASQSMEIYLFLIAAECLWLRFVYIGMKKTGHALLEFIAPSSIDVADVAADAVLAVAILLLIYLATRGLNMFLPADQQGNPLMAALPIGWTAKTVWICLSFAAGIGEEVVFRGYLQRQLRALTTRLDLAIVLQALVFGVAHIYEGQAAVMRIVLIGAVFGIMAAWRGNIRACIIAHVTIDVLAGFGIAIA
jgi:membrane protease YdiL (CAAX protease family)